MARRTPKVEGETHEATTEGSPTVADPEATAPTLVPDPDPWQPELTIGTPIIYTDPAGDQWPGVILRVDIPPENAVGAPIQGRIAVFGRLYETRQAALGPGINQWTVAVS